MSTVHEAVAKELHEGIRRDLASSPKASRITVVTIASLHSDEGGQWIIGDEAQDKKLVAARLRVCADILDGGAS